MRYELTNIPLVKRLFVSRWPQFFLAVIALVGFVFAILAGFFGTPVGSRNFGIIFVWIAWWAILLLVAVPMTGRFWCSICPIPLPGEWLQRGALLKPGRNIGIGLGKRWPNRLRNIWMQNGAFILVALFSAVVLTQPKATAIVLSAFLFVALGTSLVFERRSFCRYLCPVGGFIGLYSQLAPLEVRVKDNSVCVSHEIKTCYSGNADGYGCPWQEFPPGLIKNTYCGTCMECLRACPHDNIAIQIRPFGADLSQPRGRKLDEAYKAFIMLGSAFVYALVLLGPWGQLKMAAYSVGSIQWIVYVFGFLLLVLAFLPGLFWLLIKIGGWVTGSKERERRRFINYATALIPLGLAAWIAFSLSFVLTNLSYVGMVISDPLGWGWNIFSTAGSNWKPYLSQIVPAMQTAVLLGGLVWAVYISLKLARENLSGRAVLMQAAPVLVFCLGMTLAMMGVLIA